MIPKWSFLAKAHASVADGRKEIPSQVYVFPALRLDSQGQPIDVLSYRVDDTGALKWNSAAPLGAELKTIVEKRLAQIGFQVLPFTALTESSKDHSVTVFNLYYREASPSSDNPGADPELTWTTFARVSAATFPQDLDPNRKLDLINQEVVTLFNGREKEASVVKRSSEYLLDFIGASRDWSESINLLQ
ncbi:hypothetical protein QEH59_16485 [Coraliomargarita sp. SDUM461004]|uniref:Nudix hydrolase domain-containing protein n=1 Tax=Thalassobacterium sedimentorum TaxID=3041258 RepID=A0ABU1AML1_9BACT|nr:hypothetical protein [Coraliomargarita sp. SDUM461004]MDQ8196035.1 hypothetical protein [Coraliomargarita sp. SDUM461004]